MKRCTHGSTFCVFVRNWWRWQGAQLVPDPGARKTVIARHIHEEAVARHIAQSWNACHAPGPLSRKAEYAEEK